MIKTIVTDCPSCGKGNVVDVTKLDPIQDPVLKECPCGKMFLHVYLDRCGDLSLYWVKV